MSNQITQGYRLCFVLLFAVCGSNLCFPPETQRKDSRRRGPPILQNRLQLKTNVSGLLGEENHGPDLKNADKGLEGGKPIIRFDFKCHLC